MIQMGKHVSTEVPPALPYFGSRFKGGWDTACVCMQLLSPQPVALSPGKRIRLQFECIDQLHGQVVLAFGERRDHPK